eukprot:TRINITY_DN448_c0_g1_i8.p2 TRINITY_DN448_c0_g1~~TRINITY_DN448_c0_g1_i8.p2  ORF type:complete len:243 (-),score=7.74 TRINITY_DN448_c0_g1_i8:74-802(-)
MLTREIIRLLSATLILLTGIVIIVLWILAAFDRGEENGVSDCHGCYELFNTALDEGTLGFGTDLNDWVAMHRNPRFLLIAFGAIVGILWIITGAIGFLATTKYMAWVYLILGVITYTIFVVIFPIILERINFVTPYCNNLWATFCNTDPEWIIKHSLDSFEWFWGAALVGFLLGAMQIAAAAYLIHENEEPVVSSPQPAGVVSTKPQITFLRFDIYEIMQIIGATIMQVCTQCMSLTTIQLF